MASSVSSTGCCAYERRRRTRRDGAELPKRPAESKTRCHVHTVFSSAVYYDETKSLCGRQGGAQWLRRDINIAVIAAGRITYARITERRWGRGLSRLPAARITMQYVWCASMS